MGALKEQLYRSFGRALTPTRSALLSAPADCELECVLSRCLSHVSRVQPALSSPVFEVTFHLWLPKPGAPSFPHWDTLRTAGFIAKAGL